MLLTEPIFTPRHASRTLRRNTEHVHLGDTGFDIELEFPMQRKAGERIGSRNDRDAGIIECSYHVEHRSKGCTIPLVLSRWDG